MSIEVLTSISVDFKIIQFWEDTTIRYNIFTPAFEIILFWRFYGSTNNEISKKEENVKLDWIIKLSMYETVTYGRCLVPKPIRILIMYISTMI